MIRAIINEAKLHSVSPNGEVALSCYWNHATNPFGCMMLISGLKSDQDLAISFQDSQGKKGIVIRRKNGKIIDKQGREIHLVKAEDGFISPL